MQFAKQTFTEVEPGVSLDEIGKAGCIGPCTLYQHFPTRDALLGEVYRTEFEKLRKADQKLSDGLSPLEALRVRMLKFVDYMAMKLIIFPAIN